MMTGTPFLGLGNSRSKPNLPVTRALCELGEEKGDGFWGHQLKEPVSLPIWQVGVGSTNLPKSTARQIRCIDFSRRYFQEP
jgi:hypothetical protein